MQIDWEPEGLVEKVGSAVGVPAHAVKHALEKFRTYVEDHGGADGWRGNVNA